ncbi:MAG: ABC transporter ATP-binding protein [Gemmatimonadota bacterium]|nr:ABC transporter ATP-binding protein [Gemmatimonadota bacterium]MDH5804522.1 ABC transporter ATP-binding protein [Gemmatimonadota bacterium]
MTETQTVIETEELTKRYRKTLAVDEISFSVQSGQIFGFLGPNGSGKTTTIGMLLGIITPTSGTFRLFGNDPSRSNHEARLKIGATLEYPNFYPYLSGWDNLRIVAHIKDRGQKDIERALEIVGLTSRKKSQFKTYSLGMKQRLALAATILGDPKLILLDEPANGLDPEGMREIRHIILDLAADGKTIFLSSHLLAEVEKTCTHVAIIKEGRLLQQAGVAEITSKGSLVGLKADDIDKLESIVKEFPATVSTRQEDDFLLAELDDPDLAGLNKFVSEKGVFVSYLARRPRSLEDVFMEVTDGGEHGMGDLA